MPKLFIEQDIASNENEYLRLWIKNKIIFNEFSPGVNMDLRVAKSFSTLLKEISKGNTYPLLMDLKNLDSINIEARNYFAQRKASELVKGVALVSESSLHRIMGNIFITFNKPAVEVQFFNSKEEALVWLEEIKTLG